MKLVLPVGMLVLASLLAACGGAPAPSRVDDEVSATWTAGDDAPLQAEGLQEEGLQEEGLQAEGLPADGSGDATTQ